MVKRELINKKKLIGKMKQSNAFDISERMKFSNLIEEQRPITEQDIVKPYLDKLMIEVGNLEINKPMMSGYGFKQKSPQEIKDEVMKLIDNLLSEQEISNEID